MGKRWRRHARRLAKKHSELCKLTDIVAMTVFAVGARHTTRTTELQTALFGGGRFPASAAIAVSGFATSEIMLEVQCVAVRA